MDITKDIVLEGLCRGLLGKDGMLLALNVPDLPVNFLETFLQSSPTWGVRKQIVKHPQVTPEILAKLSRDLSLPVRAAVAANAKTPVSILMEYGESTALQIHVGLAANPVCPPALLSSLYFKYVKDSGLFNVDDGDFYNGTVSITQHLAENPSTPVDILNVLAKLAVDKDGWGYPIDFLVKNPQLPVNCVKKLVGYCKKGWSHVSKQTLKALLDHPNCPTHLKVSSALEAGSL